MFSVFNLFGFGIWAYLGKCSYDLLKKNINKTFVSPDELFNSPHVVGMEKGDGAAGIPPPHSTPKNHHGDHTPHINSLNPAQQFQVRK